MARSSRYSDTVRVRKGKGVHFGLRRSLSIEPATSDLYYTVQPGDTLHSIAYKIYKDVSLWWVVADFNEVIDPYAGLVAGDTLRVPSRARLFMELLS